MLTKTILVLSSMLVSGAASEASWQLKTEGLTLQVVQPWREQKGCYISGEKVPLQLVITNPTLVDRTIALQTRDKNGFRLPFPRGLAVRILHAEGRNAAPEPTIPSLAWTDEDGWVVQGKFSSQICKAIQRVSAECSQPGDVVTLGPGESVRRVIHLSDYMGWSLSLGEYTVQVRMFGVTSPVYALKVAGEGGCS